MSSSLLEDRQKLRSLLLYLYENNLTRYKANYYCFSKKAGALLARQVKSQQLKQSILYNHHPTIKCFLANPQDIANAISDYYLSICNLHQDPTTIYPFYCNLSKEFWPSIIVSWTSWVTIPTISNCEIQSIIKNLWNNTPGCDGFTNDYKKCINLVSPQLVLIFNMATFSGSLPKEMLQSVIVTILKPGKDPAFTNIYRPISLLNTDINFFFKSLSPQIIAYSSETDLPWPCETHAKETGPWCD